MTRHLVTLMDWEPADVRHVLTLSRELKADARAGRLEPTLPRRTLALLFEKASMRTRVSFEVAMTQLGGSTVYLSKEDVNLGRREPIKDGARVLARCVDVVAARVYSHAVIEELAAYSSVPVINALSDAAHPCQALADALTIMERIERPEEAKIVFVGDGNNVARSLATVCARLGWPFTLACPEGYGFDEGFLARIDKAAAQTGATVSTVGTPREAAEGADVLYTDVWTSMGQEAEAEQRRSDFAAFTLNDELVALGSDDCIVLHCLPAVRGEEITDSVIEGPHSAVFDQAENRLHAERGLLQMLLA